MDVRLYSTRFRCEPDIDQADDTNDPEHFGLVDFVEGSWSKKKKWRKIQEEVWNRPDENWSVGTRDNVVTVF